MKKAIWISAGVLVALVAIGVIVNETVDISLPFFRRDSRRALAERAAKVADLVDELKIREAHFNALTELYRERVEHYEASIERSEERILADAERIQRAEEALGRAEDSLRRAEKRAREGESAVTRAQGDVGTARDATNRIGGIADELEDELRRLSSGSEEPN